MASLPGSGTARGDLHQFYEPRARFDHCCCTVGQNVYVYGHSVYMTVPPPSGVVDVFNLPSGRWQQLPTTGPPPPGVHGSVCAVVGNCAFFFGGATNVDGVVQFYNTIHKLDVISMLWKELDPAQQGTVPMEKAGAGMVSYYESNLLVFSGYGPLPADPHTRPANYVPNSVSDNLRGWTNELHLFDLQSRTWSVPETTGTPPPACVGCSFTRVDKRRGVVFGGVGQQYHLLPNHIHILNFQSWHWLRVESSGASGQPWPPPRDSHTAVSVCDPDGGSPHPALLVCWGQKDRRVLDDTWMLELSVTTCQWKQVTLPSALRGRTSHTTAVVHHDDHHKQLVHFGGLHEVPPVGQWRSAVPVAETTIVELESSGHPGDWVATRVNQLGRTVAGGDGVAMAIHHLSLGGAIVKKEAKWSESPAHLKDPQSPEVKHKVVLAEKMRELQQAYKNVCDQHEELQLAYLREKMEHISGSQSESSEDMKAMGDIPLKKAKRELYEHTVKSQGEATEDVKTTEYLRGVEVIAETQFIMKGRHRQTFKWEGHGLKLSIPEDAIQSSEAESVISIKAGLAGQFELPAGAQLVSPMYWLYCKHIFQHPITLELQHCATIRNNSEHSSLCFIVAKCSQKLLPYKFKFLDKGTFSELSSYGSVEVQQFSIFGLVIRFIMQLFVQPPPPQPRRYFSQLFYFDKGKNTWQLDFIITWNQDLCITHVRRNYSPLAVEGPHTEVEFEKESISLAIPEDGIIGNGWTITPLNAQVITKQQVDSFKSGQRIPTCQLQVRLATTDSPEILSYKLTLEGAKEPFNFLTITCTPVIPVYGPVHGRKRPRQSDPSDVAPLVFPEPQLKDVVLIRVNSWYDLGLQLDLEDSRLEAIKSTNHGNTEECRRDMFRTWLRSQTDPSYQQLVRALVAIGEQKEAKHLCEKYGILM